MNVMRRLRERLRQIEDVALSPTCPQCGHGRADDDRADGTISNPPVRGRCPFDTDVDVTGWGMPQCECRHPFHA